MSVEIIFGDKDMLAVPGIVLSSLQPRIKPLVYLGVHHYSSRLHFKKKVVII